MRALRKTLALTTLAWTLPACEQPPRPLPTAASDLAVPRLAAAAPTATAPAAAGSSEPAYTYQYNPAGKSDPFRSPHEAGPHPAPPAPCQRALCQWDVEQLKLVAVVTGHSTAVAMVEDPQGRGYVLRPNTQVGRQGGKVTRIHRDSVTVTEYLPGPQGATPVPVRLKLARAERAEPPYDLLADKPWGR